MLFGQGWEKGREQQEREVRLASGQTWAELLRGWTHSGTPRRAACGFVCLVLSRAKWHSIIEDKDPSLSSPPAALHGRGAGIKTVQGGAGTEDVPNAGSLSHGNGQERPQDITQGENGNDKTQLKSPLVPLSHREGTGEFRSPWACGLLAAPQSAAPFILPTFSTLGTFSRRFHVD